MTSSSRSAKSRLITARLSTWRRPPQRLIASEMDDRMIERRMADPQTAHATRRALLSARPWRVEGERADGEHDERDARTPACRARPAAGASGGSCSACWSLNIVLGQLIPSSEDKRLDVPYTFFRTAGRGGQRQGGQRRAATSSRASSRQAVEVREEGAREGASRPSARRSRRTTSCSSCCSSKKVEVNARPIDEGRSFLATLLISFGPTLLIVGLLIYFLRRSAARRRRR